MRPVPSDLWPVKYWEAREEENMKYLWLLNLLISTSASGMGFKRPLNAHLSFLISQWGCPSGWETGLGWPTSRSWRPLTSGQCAAPPRGRRGCAHWRGSAGARTERTWGSAPCSSQPAVKVNVTSNVSFKYECFAEKVSCHLESTLKSLEFKNPSFPELEVDISIVHANPPDWSNKHFHSLSRLEPAQRRLELRPIFAA